MKRLLLPLSLVGKKKFVRPFFYLALFTIFGVASAPRASGQTGPQFVGPTTLYRFQVSYWDGGHLLTGWYSEGPANNYTYDPMNSPFLNGLGIYLPPAGYTPDPASGLVPLHRWLVIEDGWRTYFYYSTGYIDTTGTNYHYQGITGYVYPPGMTQSPSGLELYQLSVFYSQDLGYWNGFGGGGGNNFNFTEDPPNRPGKLPYVYHGSACSMPFSFYNPQFPPSPNPGQPSIGMVLFYPPPPPPSGGGGSGGGSCTPPQGAVGACQHNGGWWDYESCQCEY
jgi:hypothetical protein